MSKPNKAQIEKRLLSMKREIEDFSPEEESHFCYLNIRIGMFLADYERYAEKYISLHRDLQIFRNELLVLFIELRKEVYPNGKTQT